MLGIILNFCGMSLFNRQGLLRLDITAKEGEDEIYNDNKKSNDEENSST